MPWPDALTLEEKVGRALSATNAMIGNMADLLHLHELNQVVCYSDVLSRQIPISHAANSFRVLTGTLVRAEIAKLCTFWDSSARDRNSIPSVRQLLAYADVRAELRRMRIARVEAGQSFTAEDDDPELLAAIEELSNRLNEEDSRSIEDELERFMATYDADLAGPLIGAARNFRDRFLSHSLAEELAEQRPAAIRFGDEEALIALTIPRIDTLNAVVRGSNYDWDLTRRIARDNAVSLWQNSRLDVLR